MDQQRREKLLFHICCAPDATVVAERLEPDYDITGYFYNPNIHPQSEYTLRVNEMEELAREIGLKLIVGPYDADRWFDLVKGMEDEPEGGARCEVCFRMRLESTARLAQEQGFDFFTTVLTVSPHKNADLINAIGSEMSAKYAVQFLSANFKKKDGFKRSIELSKIYGLYRQNYCGCIYSKR
ncbi:epoxyqueuosine reductase QueH [candidate division KSB1 bacterium]|nr:epoxyqueuosine reductase QueH [candidate division KSB1 bacterium]